MKLTLLISFIITDLSTVVILRTHPESSIVCCNSLSTFHSLFPVSYFIYLLIILLWINKREQFEKKFSSKTSLHGTIRDFCCIGVWVLYLVACLDTKKLSEKAAIILIVIIRIFLTRVLIASTFSNERKFLWHRHRFFINSLSFVEKCVRQNLFLPDSNTLTDIRGRI